MAIPQGLGQRAIIAAIRSEPRPQHARHGQHRRIVRAGQQAMPLERAGQIQPPVWALVKPQKRP
jgi:hypothetical protein